MPKICKAAREAIEARRHLVLVCLKSANRPMPCMDICEATGLTMHHVRAAMRALVEGGAAKVHGERPPGHSTILRYESTGDPYNEVVAAKEHKQQAKLDHHTEPAGRIVEKKLAPGHRLIRFGRDYKTGSGQLADNRRTAGSVLNSIY